MILPGRNRVPRADAIEPMTADVAYVWDRISEARRVAIAVRAAEHGISVDAYIRERFAAAAAALFGPPPAPPA